MMRQKKIILALCGIVGMLAFLCLLCRLWPFLAISMLQRGMQTRIHCWVKVVDQDNKGVKGYKCRVVEEHAPLWFFSSGKDIVRVFETGEDGSFEYTSKGATGRVFFGYDVRQQWQMNPTHLMQSQYLRITPREYQRGMNERPTGYSGSLSNPYIIRVYTVGSPQKLLYWKQRVSLQEKTDYVCIDVLSGRTWESMKPEGDVAMADGQYTKEGAPICGIRMAAGANCSLYPVLDDWGLEPPEGGYVKELCFSKDWEDKHVYYHGTQYYFRLLNPTTEGIIYGRLTLGLSPRVNGAQLQSYINLQGERNLYYKGYIEDPSGYHQIIRDFMSPPVVFPEVHSESAEEGYGPFSMVSSLPADGEKEVPTGSVILVRFCRPVAPSSLGPEQVKVRAAGREVQGNLRLREGGRVLAFSPGGLLPRNEVVTVEMKGLKDPGGRLLEPPVALSFTTTVAHPQNVGEVLSDEEGKICIRGRDFFLGSGAKLVNASHPEYEPVLVEEKGNRCFEACIQGAVEDRLVLTTPGGDNYEFSGQFVTDANFYH